MQALFPQAVGQSIEEQQYRRRLTERIKLRLRYVLEGVDTDRQVKAIDAKIEALRKTYDYAAEEVKSDIGFEKSCMFINESMHKDAKTMTLMEYETALKILRERSEEMERRTNKRH